MICRNLAILTFLKTDLIKKIFRSSIHESITTKEACFEECKSKATETGNVLIGYTYWNYQGYPESSKIQGFR